MSETPQLENGYIRVATQILKDWQKLNLSPYQWRVLFHIIEFTYGFHCKENKISVSHIVKATGIRQAHISRALKELISKNIVSRKSGFCAYNKNSKSWKLNIPVEVSTYTSRGIKNIPVEGDNKNTLKITNKDNNAALARHYLSKKQLEEHRGGDGRGGLKSIGEVLDKNPSRVKTEWQDLALRIIESLKVGNTRKGAYFKAVKEFPRAKIMDAFSFAADYPKPEMKDKIFFWKLAGKQV